MNHAAFFGVVVLVLVVVVNLFDGYAREKAGKTVEIVLRPFLPRMVVAPG
jgi:hypothetical protein